MAEAKGSGNGHGSHPEASGQDRGMIWIPLAEGVYELRDPRTGLPIRYAVLRDLGERDPTNGGTSVQ
jgi:hypothetical protein